MNPNRQMSKLLLLALLLPVIAACGGTSTSTSSTPQTSTGAAKTTAAGAATMAPAGAGTTATVGSTAGIANTGVAAGAVTATKAAATTAAGSGASAASSTATMAGGAMTTTAATSTTGAAGATSATAGTGAAAAGPDFSKMQVEPNATLTVSSWGDPSEQKVNQDSFDRFTKLFPKVKITYQPSPKDYQIKMKADAAGGTLADVFYLDASLMNAFASNGILLDLAPAMQQLGVKKDDYIGQLADEFIVNNKVYGLPKDFGSLALFVRDDMAQKAGIDPKSIKTWDDWKNAAAKMSSGSGNTRVYGQCSSSDVERIGALALQNGGSFVENKKATFNSDKVVQAYQFFYEMKKSNNAALPSDVAAGWCGEAFAKGNVAMAMEGGWLAPFMADAKNGAADVKYTIIPLPMPTGGKQADLVFTNAWSSSASSKFPKAAAALVLFLTSAQNQQPITVTGFALPTVKSVLNDPYFAKNPNAKVLADAGTYGTPSDIVFGGPAKTDDVKKPLNQAGEKIWLGQGDPKTNLDQAVPAVNQVLSQ
ncbi:MAG: hypothetical protein NVS2B7_27080 [Herpetosiphon sp.]